MRSHSVLAISSFYILLSIAILLGNSVILIALKKETLYCSTQCPQTLSLVSMVLVSLCIQYFMYIAYKHWEVCRLTEMFSYMATFILCGISFLTVTVISVDRLLALLKTAIQTNCYYEARSYFTSDVLD